MLEMKLKIHNLVYDPKDTPKPGQYVLGWDKWGKPGALTFGLDGYGWYDDQCRYVDSIIVAWAELEEILVPELSPEIERELRDIQYVPVPFEK